MPNDQQPSSHDTGRPAGFSAMGIFLFFGAVTASVSAIPLLWPGTSLDRLWTLNPKAYQELAPFGSSVGILFLVLGVTIGMAGAGWFRRRLWGWRLAVAIITTQVLGDLVNCFRGEWLAGATGVIIAGMLLLFLLRPKMRSAFH
jgi:hypothetical protein